MNWKTKAAHEVGPGEDAAQFDTFSSDIDLCAAAASSQTHAARFLRVEAVGSTPTLVLQLGPERTERTFVVSAGWTLECQIAGIVADGTDDVTRVLVSW